jgi:hypothetical protein
MVWIMRMVAKLEDVILMVAKQPEDLLFRAAHNICCGRP